MPRSRTSAPIPLPCACATLRRASRAVTQMYAAALRGFDLEITQFTLLQALDRSGEVLHGQLGNLLALDSTTLSRTLRPLLRKGWIAARPGEDARERLLRITTAGRRALERAQPSWKAVQDELRHKLGSTGWNTLMLAADQATAAARQE